jgi:hypothetical protein
MRRSVSLAAAAALFCTVSVAQVTGKYYEYVEQAKGSFERKQYKASGAQYASAFRLNGGKAYCDDRYDAARAWAMAGNKDSAFVQLLKVAMLYDYTDYTHLSEDPAFRSLKKDDRWKTVTETVKHNIGKSDSRLNSAVVLLLDSVYRNHHSLRLQEVSVKNQYGESSEQLKGLRSSIHKADSVNLTIVKDVLAKYGWLGRDVAGFIGNYTLALIMQHADLSSQEQNLSMIRQAFKDGKIEAYDYALLEDKVALREGKKQLYGSVIVNVGGKNHVAPLEDPDGLEKRRKELGLRKMNDYLSDWGLRWDPAAYKKDLLLLEKESIAY